VSTAAVFLSRGICRCATIMIQVKLHFTWCCWRVQQLSLTSPAETKQKIEQMLQGYSMGGSCSEIDPKFNNGGPAELSLVDEEKSLQYIEISLQEVSREVQRRREEARMKRS
jgi:hypothetical protein